MNIKDKIRKLLNLAANNPNEAEAAAAAEKASRLMLENGILEADICSDEDSQKVVDLRKVYATKMNNWHGALASGIATMNLCDTYFNSQYVDKSKSAYRAKLVKETGINFLGTEGRVEVSHQMLDYLIQAIERLVTKDLRYAKKWDAPVNPDRSYWTQWKNSYRYAAARRLRNRMIEIHKLRQSQGIETSDGQHINALTVQTADEQARAAIELYKQQNLKLRQGRRMSGPTSQSGYDAGLTAGDSVSLNNQVGSTSNALRLN